jgi:hypothetical protein
VVACAVRRREGIVVLRRAAIRTDVDLVAGLEAVLAGRYVEYLERRGERLPPWAWTNLLAHGSEERLRRAAGLRDRPVWEVNVWQRARSYLAAEVLDAAEWSGSLHAVQTEALIPLELDLVSWIPSRFACTGQWATRVLTALEDHRRWLQASPSPTT